ncbi:beta-glucuronosyltransferase GlcAT14A-like isoform X2 [Triticum dicoccoides]|uniref:beta-glucuronosyltransferase GlcAT14A-like isoform X2 n=1 Tax=Triticum dicoccoides TaxID=85692 RepID=UPI00084353EF|nr:beta-glucuronosyltransferase GlcAT14A-like isoform X2 [Triticum dicoccoides]XP_044322018.1 beta-glucuronosyltransferase GlcAT14A-like isoform X3 [Triticum aestivum]XP_044322026.1 beta-glucuronosyltransferase GlcAT14A-like isoform X4 [Triticum aestivum]
MRIRGLAMSGGREVAISAVFTALLVVSILFLPSVLLTSGRLGPSSAKEWPFLAAAKDGGYYPVSFAYLISASTGDAERAARLLAALYHPANSYLLHLDREAPAEEHRRLAELVSGQPVYGRVGNVWIVGKPNLVTYRGPTMLSTTLHAMAVLLRVGRRWDWFVNLSASDYPLVTQDDLMEAFSRLPRDLNFIQHTSHLGWKIKKRARPVILDTALYEADRSELLRPSPNITTNRRGLPTAFKLFTGSAWTMLSRRFAEYCVMGWDNLARTLLLYHANLVSSPEFYFQTVACNSREFRNATVNSDLHFIRWDTPPKQHPLYLGPKDYRRMVLSSAAFARKFRDADLVLDRIDREILKRRPPSRDDDHGDHAASASVARHGGQFFSYGGWCSEGEVGLCSNPWEPSRKGAIKPGAGSRRLRVMLNKMLSGRNFRKQQCR